jgi:hypothetical protein
MKALSVRQPWAYLIVSGGKDIENRKWKTSYRGPVLIYASNTIDAKSYDRLKKEGIDLPPLETLKTGGIIGETEIVDCVDSSDSVWFSGPYGFKLKNSKRLPFEPCRGRKSLSEPEFF